MKNFYISILLIIGLLLQANNITLSQQMHNAHSKMSQTCSYEQIAKGDRACLCCYFTSDHPFYSAFLLNSKPFLFLALFLVFLFYVLERRAYLSKSISQCGPPHLKWVLSVVQRK